MESLINTHLGPYHLIELVRRGGMATVFKAHQQSLGRFVAIKMLEQQPDRQFVERFKVEAQIVARFQHPNILQIYDYGEQDGRLYLAMPYIEDGASLADVGKPMPPSAALQLVIRLLTALEYAHARGVIHRDVKPSNVLLPTPDWPLLADFGIAKSLDDAGNNLTAVGQVIGTAAYMAPEQAAGERIDPRTDLYAVGVLLYELVTGQVPFGSGPHSGAAPRQSFEPPLSPRSLNPAIPAGLEPILQRALAKQPDQRYESARAMAADLERIAAQEASGTENATAIATQITPTSIAQLGPHWAPAILAAALMIVLLGGAAGALAWRAAAPPATAPPATAPPTPTMANAAAGIASQAAGKIFWRDQALRNDKVIVAVEGLPPPEAGQVYAAWLSGEAGDLALGALTPDEGGQLIVAYISPRRVNLLGSYNRVSITIAPEAAAKTELANVILTGALPEAALVHIRHVLFSFDATPYKVGFALGLRQEAEKLLVHALLLQEAYTAGDLHGQRRHAEHLVGIIEGTSGEHVGDLDGDGRIENPGDGFGLLPSEQEVGYIEGTVGHALLAAAAPDATEDIKAIAALVQTTGANVHGRVSAIRDRALRVGQAQSAAETRQDVAEIVELATYALDGVDRNGNEQIEPLPDEGGALTAYWHAQLLADTWLSAANQE